MYLKCTWNNNDRLWRRQEGGGSSVVPNFRKSGGLAGSQFLEVFAGKEGGDFF